MITPRKISDYISGIPNAASIIANGASIPGDGKEYIIVAQYFISKGTHDLILVDINGMITNASQYTPTQDVASMTAEVSKIAP